MVNVIGIMLIAEANYKLLAGYAFIASMGGSGDTTAWCKGRIWESCSPSKKPRWTLHTRAFCGCISHSARTLVQSPCVIAKMRSLPPKRLSKILMGKS